MDAQQNAMADTRSEDASGPAHEQTACPVCSQTMSPSTPRWVLRCDGCGFLSANIANHAGTDSSQTVDEDARHHGLEALRSINFATILGLLESMGFGNGSKLLDVGCAHGWFLQAAESRGFLCTGLEPDSGMVTVARTRAKHVVHGFFPQDVPAKGFDVIIFNDVFEHLANVDEAMRSCAELLAPGGVLVINLPNRKGFFYRVAGALARVGVEGPLVRMWQLPFPSPHLSYFDKNTLRALAERFGLKHLRTRELASMSTRGLWARLRADRALSRARAAVTCGAVLAAYPLIKIAPSDAILCVFGRDRVAGRAA